MVITLGIEISLQSSTLIVCTLHFADFLMVYSVFWVFVSQQMHRQSMQIFVAVFPCCFMIVFHLEFCILLFLL